MYKFCNICTFNEQNCMPILTLIIDPLETNRVQSDDLYQCKQCHKHRLGGGEAGWLARGENVPWSTREKQSFSSNEKLNPFVCLPERQTRGFYYPSVPAQIPRVCRSGARYGAAEVEPKSKVQLFWAYYSEVKNHVYKDFRTCIGKLRSCAIRWWQEMYSRTNFW